MIREQISLLKFLKGLGTNLETTMLGATIIGIVPILFKNLLIIEKVGNYKDNDWTKFIALQLFPDCMDLWLLSKVP